MNRDQLDLVDFQFNSTVPNGEKRMVERNEHDARKKFLSTMEKRCVSDVKPCDKSQHAPMEIKVY